MYKTYAWNLQKASRITKMKDRVGEAVRVSREAWFEHRKALRELRQAAYRYPVSASTEFDFIAELLRSKALEDMHYFAVVSPQARYLQNLETGKVELTEPYNLSTGEQGMGSFNGADLAANRLARRDELPRRWLWSGRGDALDGRDGRGVGARYGSRH
jgi:hypothetical protein